MAHKRVAVVGSDHAALSAVYTLWKQSEGADDIHIFEESAQFPTAANSVKLTNGSSVSLEPMSLSTSAHPNLAHQLKELGVKLEETPNTLTIQNSKSAIRTASFLTSLVITFFASPLKALKLFLTTWNFYKQAWRYIDVVEKQGGKHVSLGDFCNERSFGRDLTEGFVVPLAQSIFPCSKDTCLGLDAYRLFKYMSKHQMLTFWKRTWWKVSSASKTYSEAVLDRCKPTLHTGNPIKKLRRNAEGKWVINDASEGQFDAVVLTSIPQLGENIECQDPNVKKMIQLANKTEKEEDVMIFHNDVQLMPSSRNEWSSVNVKNDHVTYWGQSKELLQKNEKDFFLTIQSRANSHKSKVSKGSYLYEPIPLERIKLTEKNLDIGKKIDELQGSSGVYVCTPTCPLSTVEDKVKAGLTIVNHIHGKLLRNPLQCQDRDDVSVRGLLMRTIESFMVLVFRWYTKNLVSKSAFGVLFPNHDMVYLEGNYKEEPVSLVQVNSYKFVPMAVLYHEWGWMVAALNRYCTADNVTLFGYLLCYNLPPKRTRFQRMASYFRPTPPKCLFDFYDHVEDFFGCILDESKTFSVALFKNENDSLAQAQYQKLDRLIEKLNVDENSHVLEIGAGWGSFACRLAQKKGCKVTAVTTSPIEPIQEMAKEMKLEHKVEAQSVDFLDIPKKFPGQKFDAVVLIEVIEENYGRKYDKYFKVLGNHVKEGGQVAMQLNVGFYDYDRTASDLVKEFAFPGGTLPTLGDVYTLAAKYDLALMDALCITKNYTKTTAGWMKNFHERTKAMGAKCPFDKEFEYTVYNYLQVGPAMVNSNSLNSYQVVFHKNTFSTSELL